MHYEELPKLFPSSDAIRMSNEEAQEEWGKLLAQNIRKIYKRFVKYLEGKIQEHIKQLYYQ